MNDVVLDNDILNNDILNKDEEVVEKAIELSVVEVIIGSTLHNLKVPLAGHGLSLNQGFLLGRFSSSCVSRFQKFKLVFEISIVTALMKALSPSAKKVGPMVSISAQGFLYGLGALIGGKGKIGSIFGMVLLSLWSFIQPAVTYLVIYGPDLIQAVSIIVSKASKFTNTPQENLRPLLFLAIFVKAIMGVGLVFVPESFSYDNFLKKIPKSKDGILFSKKTFSSPSKGAVNDLLRPGFIFSFLFMGLFFYLSGRTVEKSIWLLFRSLGIAFIIFYLARSPHFHYVIEKLALKSKVIKRFYDLAGAAKARLSRI